MGKDLTLAVDVGTGGVRAALVDRQGTIIAFDHRAHEQIVPRYGWSEQRPAEWWEGTAGSVRGVLDKVPGAASRVAAVAVCGQMHGTVLLDDEVEQHLGGLSPPSRNHRGKAASTLMLRLA